MKHTDLSTLEILDKADKSKRALEILAKLPPKLCHNFDFFIEVGSCLKPCGDELFYEWYEWGFKNYSPYCDGTLESKSKRVKEWERFETDGDGTLRLSQIESYSSDKEITAKTAIHNRLEKMWRHRLRLNTMSKEVELDGEKLTPDYLYLDLLKYGICSSKDFVIDCVAKMAVANEYNPLKTYLDKCNETHKSTEILDTIASTYLGTTEVIYDVMVKKTLISAVARAMRPGCKVDTTLILQGGQGVGKSSFFKILAGDFFDDGLGSNVTDQNEKMRLSAHWILEWGELERIFSQRDSSSIKAFLTSTHDSYRRPWGKNIETYPRHCVIVGSTNRDDFLNDSTGSRRFWVVPVAKKIDLRKLKENREAIWGAAVQCYLNKEAWFLNTQEEMLRQELNKEYQKEEPWYEAIANHCLTRNITTTAEILQRLLDIPLAKQDKFSQMRVTDVLRSLGWVKKKSNGTNFWVSGVTSVTNSIENKTEKEIEHRDTCRDTSGTPHQVSLHKQYESELGTLSSEEVALPSNQDSVSNTDESVTLVTPKSSRSGVLEIGDRVRVNYGFLNGKIGEVFHIDLNGDEKIFVVAGDGWVSQRFTIRQLERV
ncbi:MULTISPECIES: virulence-associated E family protein [Pseudanabaena]|uniref:Virulence-associated E family protein n=2 Tax=Pseudanabaena TaxID=1152 RepID=L8N3H0_9CYAN|nr:MULTISPECIES: virulence-associated E family protein [Pseudanabaena]ELS32803.1 virulence-associated E family protein [Pseudanabaena biceps PCC 7429]MDG3494992.1 virulence-associated E family protein [Pseudanabaena catenata USMAC16]